MFTQYITHQKQADRKHLTQTSLFHHPHFQAAAVLTSQEVLTHRIKVVKILVHANDFIIELIIAAGSGQKCVSISDEHVEQVHNLNKWKEVATGTFIPNLFCNRSNTHYVQNFQRNSLQLQQIFLIVPKRLTRSLNTLIKGQKHMLLFCIQRTTEQKKKKLTNLEN